ncbi:hypothetical protein RD792_005047 [Penstemon davidsonii]|uniref:Photolyase/cryptochrome alpha/beta domain-containing protein n=1 Tax=Penstemon davidsonii TaxID=160366 RepID=A0ABR0DJW5_9LAMI|nr:hypothetical protein RD792_005047 [Penstemon davidsonii]
MSTSSSIPAVHPGRIRVLKQASVQSKPMGPVVYWMFRDQRLKDNWALIHAVHQANQWNAPVAIAFNLLHQFKGAKARQLGFMLRGLKKLYSDIQSNIINIPFFLFQASTISTHNHSTYFSPLREVRQWKEEICQRVNESEVSIHEVDAHNVVPVWVASEKLEYGARTIRGKINKKLPEYLVDFPDLIPPKHKWPTSTTDIDWDSLIANVLREGAEVPELEWCEPGEQAGLEVLIGNKNGFLTARLKNYSSDRNNPLKPKGLSGLSPYLHFGQISAQRCALEARKVRNIYPQAVDVFLEELIVRRELADNFCFYQPHYDSLQGAWDWARKTLMDHASDKREHVYTREQLEKAQTADPLWNASQLELVHYGKYHIDGRDPNGYVGCMWSICGVHDQGWRERSVFGKIRYMNYAGCKRKFDVDGYIAYIKRIVGECKKRKAQDLLNNKAKQLRC